MRLVIYSKAAWPESLLASIIEGKVGQQFGEFAFISSF